MPADDRFVTYYAEKLWAWLPAWHRELDGGQQAPGALRAFIEVLAGQAATLRRSQDRLWEDQFIERCDRWAVPYLGDLVATRLVSSLLPREQRIDVAKTLYYRRRAGTLRVLEELINDIGGFEGVVNEGHARLLRTPHGLDPAGAARAGRWSGTPPGALPDLRHPLGARQSDGAFDEFHHTPEMRAPRGRAGRHGITRLVFHLYRTPAWRIEGVRPADAGAGFLSFDPSGRDIPLFARRSRAQVLAEDAPQVASPVFGLPEPRSPWDQWTRAQPWEIPAPIACRLLGDVAYTLSAERLAPLWTTLGAPQRLALERLYGLRVRSEARLSTLLDQAVPPLSLHLADIRRDTLATDCGKAALLQATGGSLAILPDGSTPLAIDTLAADDLSSPVVAWAPWQEGAIDAERGRFVLRAAADPQELQVDYHYGFPGRLGAGVYERAPLPWARPAPALPAVVATVSGGGVLPAAGSPVGTLRVDDNQRYDNPVDDSAVVERAIQSLDGRRPYLRLTADWTFDADAAGNAVLVLDGLWIGADATPRDLVLAGDWEHVEIRACTLDPGGIDAAGAPLGRVRLRIDGSVERLVVQSSIVCDIAVGATGTLARLELADTVVHPSPAAGGRLELPDTDVHGERLTVIGGLQGWRLTCSDSLFTGVVETVDLQTGCFRFSAAHQDSSGHVAHPHEACFFADAASLLVSTRFGDPDYASLSQAPEVALQASADDIDGQASIHTGASNDGEMGAFNALAYPLRLRALRAKIDEYMPFGLLPVLVTES